MLGSFGVCVCESMCVSGKPRGWEHPRLTNLNQIRALELKETSDRSVQPFINKEAPEKGWDGFPVRDHKSHHLVHPITWSFVLSVIQQLY